MQLVLPPEVGNSLGRPKQPVYHALAGQNKPNLDLRKPRFIRLDPKEKESIVAQGEDPELQSLQQSDPQAQPSGNPRRRELTLVRHPPALDLVELGTEGCALLRKAGLGSALATHSWDIGGERLSGS